MHKTSNSKLTIAINTTLLSFVHFVGQKHTIADQDFLAALMQGHLQVVVLQDFQQSVFEARDFQMVWDALDESQWLDFSANILQQATNKVCVNSYK